MFLVPDIFEKKVVMMCDGPLIQAVTFGPKLQIYIISNKIINKFTLTQHQLLLEQELIQIHFYVILNN